MISGLLVDGNLNAANADPNQSRSHTQNGVTEHKATAQDVQALKNYIGTYEENKNYNQIINGHGTGLQPPTEQEWAEIAADSEVIENVALADNPPASVDQSTTVYFPPIGSQGALGSCVAWSVGYYTKTFQEAQEHNWGVSAAKWQNMVPSPEYQSKIMSPEFIYNLCNNGVDSGLNYANTISLLCNIGCCTWDKMPYNQSDYVSWPTEEAWTQAALYRGDKNGIQYLYVYTDQGIGSLKSWVASGHLATISIDAGQYNKLSSSDVWTSTMYVNPKTNHANTIVGYDDSISYVENGTTKTGAFKVANSWGVGGWEQVPDGFYWISYEAMKQAVTYCMCYNDMTDYKPELLAAFSINHPIRSECTIQIGIGNPVNTSVVKSFNQYVSGGNHPFCANKIVMDITEFKTLVSDENKQTYFISVYDSTGTSATGTINSFSINGVSSSSVPCSTVNGKSVYVNVSLSPSPPPVPPAQTLSWADKNWTIITGSWNVTNGRLYGTDGDHALISADNIVAANYAVTVNTIVNSGAESSLVLRYVDRNNFYYIGIGCWGHQYSIGRMLNGIDTELAGSGASWNTIQTGVTYNLKAVADGSTLTLIVNGTPVIQATDGSIGLGGFGVRTYGSSIQVLDIAVSTPPPTPPLPTPTPPIVWAGKTWTVSSGTWSTSNNRLLGSGSAVALITADNTAYTDYGIAVTSIVTAGQESGVVLRYIDDNNFYWMGIGCWGHQYSISRMQNGVATELSGQGSAASTQTGANYNLKALAVGNTLTLYVNDAQVLQTTDSSLGYGRFGIRTYGSSIQALDATLTPPPTPTPTEPPITPTPAPIVTNTPTNQPTTNPAPTSTPAVTSPTSQPTKQPTQTESPTATAAPTVTPSATPADERSTASTYSITAIVITAIVAATVIVSLIVVYRSRNHPSDIPKGGLQV